MKRYQGRLVEWHDEQGYGFIQGISDPKHQRIFLHIKSFKQNGPRPITGCVVEYELGIDNQSRPQALQVSYVKAKQVQSSHSSMPSQSKTRRLAWHPIYILMIIYWVLLFVLSAFGKLPTLSLLIIMLINAYTYWVYYQDKQAAIAGQTRISEQHLLLMSALGGWTSAWFAMQHFHHKRQKAEFQRNYWLSISINILLVAFAVWVQSALLA